MKFNLKELRVPTIGDIISLSEWKCCHRSEILSAFDERNILERAEMIAGRLGANGKWQAGAKMQETSTRRTKRNGKRQVEEADEEDEEETSERATIKSRANHNKVPRIRLKRTVPYCSAQQLQHNQIFKSKRKSCQTTMRTNCLQLAALIVTCLATLASGATSRDQPTDCVSALCALDNNRDNRQPPHLSSSASRLANEAVASRQIEAIRGECNSLKLYLDTSSHAKRA